MLKEISGIEVKYEKNIEKEARKIKLINKISYSILGAGVLSILLGSCIKGQFLYGLAGMAISTFIYIMIIRFTYRTKQAYEICSMINNNKLLSIKVNYTRYETLIVLEFYYEKRNGDVDMKSIDPLCVKRNTKVNKVRIDLDDFILYEPFIE